MNRQRALALVVTLAAVVGVVDHLTTPVASLSELSSLARLDRVTGEDPALVVMTRDALTAVNAGLLYRLPLTPALRLENAVAGAVIALTGLDDEPDAPALAPARDDADADADADVGSTPQIAMNE